MITFEQARDIVAAKCGPTYPAEAHFLVAPWGWETLSEYVVVAGSYANVYGVDAYTSEFGVTRAEAERYFYIDGGPTMLVDKQTGEYREVFHYGDFDPVPGGVPVGEHL